MIKSKLINHSFNLILVQGLDKVEIVHYSDILYLKYNGNYTDFFLEDRNVLSFKNLGVYEKKLTTSFFKIHRSFIVNLEKIK